MTYGPDPAAGGVTEASCLRTVSVKLRRPYISLCRFSSCESLWLWTKSKIYICHPWSSGFHKEYLELLVFVELHLATPPCQRRSSHPKVLGPREVDSDTQIKCVRFDEENAMIMINRYLRRTQNSLLEGDYKLVPDGRLIVSTLSIW